MKESNAFCNFSIQLLFFGLCLFVAGCSCLKLGETCSSNNECEAGLRCEACPANGNTRARCIRTRPLSPTSKVKGLAFNKYSWLTTHNSFALINSKSQTGTILLSPSNQEDTVTSQLNNGVRGIMLDVYDFNNDIWLCHSFGGNCFNYTAYQPAINVLKEIEAFLAANPSEIVTIFIEDYVLYPQGLTKIFDASGLKKYWFPVSKMPKDGEDWPTLDDMVQNNQRLVVFTSKADKEISEGIAYTWKYVVENQYGDSGMKAGSCPNRVESLPMSSKRVSLVVLNYFPAIPNVTESCFENSAPLIGMTKSCYEAAGQRWPNFISVDFYQRSDGGGALQALDEVNGQLTCGCANIAYCRENAPRGTCDVPQIAPPPPAADANAHPQPSSHNASDTNIPYLHVNQSQVQWIVGTIMSIAPPPGAAQHSPPPSSNIAYFDAKPIQLQWLLGTILIVMPLFWL
ncbi:PI-PLC X domain-containing protein At5g67130 [Jatropha curcas]|uniref:PI-PLC X domain-containing protein At5g67130 n=1 Tax=Jatropha curcas TaxID=180498 RepID=UPI0005FB4371|nr:PI-PLC X domain-containing protein At5g67130 [Jatropha curcas]